MAEVRRALPLLMGERWFAWNPTAAIVGAVAAIPAVVVAFSDIAAAAALGVGVLPAAIVGSRRCAGNESSCCSADCSSGYR